MATFLHQWIKQYPLLKASIGLTHYQCRAIGCKCRKGARHTVYYLSYRKLGQTHTLHIPKPIVPQIKRLCQNWKNFNRWLEVKTHDLVHELIKEYRKSQSERKE